MASEIDAKVAEDEIALLHVFADMCLHREQYEKVLLAIQQREAALAALGEQQP